VPIAFSPRVLVCIPSHGTGQLGHTVRQLQGISAWNLRTDVVLHTTHPLDPALQGLRLTNVVVPTELGEVIPWLHRRVMAERRNDYDLFVYLDNDILLEAHGLATFLELDAILPEGILGGLLRYEFADGDPLTRYLPDAHGDFQVLEGVERHAGELFFSICNKFASSFLLTRAHLHRALRSGAFLREPGPHGVYGFVESAATDVYTLCGLRKVFSLPRLESHLVHHLSNRYANETWGFWQRKPHTVTSLEKLVKDASGGHHPGSGTAAPAR
jgi:hypothetical protein